MEKNIFKFDKNRCVGCGACAVACMNENGFQQFQRWRNIHNSNSGHLPDLPLFYLSLACNHCDDAPCLKNCPALAYSRDEKTGAVIHHPEKCMGCKYCTWACPFDAPKYNPEKGVVEKCTFCNHRIEDGLKPACANLCPTDALDFKTIEFSREESDKSSPVAVSVGSNIKIIPLRNEKTPEMDTALFADQKEEKRISSKHKISVKEEWPLLIFTYLVIVFSSVWFSGITVWFPFEWKAGFIAAGAAASLFSFFHLGKIFRGPRSILNIKNSWISREILFYQLFLAGIFADFFLFPVPQFVNIIFGLLLLVSVDRIYHLAMWRWKVKIHYAQAMPAALNIFLFMTGYIYALVILAAARTMLYVYNSNSERRLRISNDIFTVMAIAAAPVLYFVNHGIEGLVVVFLAELLLRMRFYNDLNLPEISENGK